MHTNSKFWEQYLCTKNLSDDQSTMASLISPFYSSSPSNYSPCIDSPSYQATHSMNSKDVCGSNLSKCAGQAFFGPDFNISQEFFKSNLNADVNYFQQEISNLSLSAVSRPSQCYSKKVFIGGIPAGTTQETLHLNFVKFGKNQIDWPKKTSAVNIPPDGYAFVVFEEESSVCKLLQMCTKIDNKYTFYLQCNDHQFHTVEIKTWLLKNANFVRNVGWRKYKRFSVFVGGVSRTCSAEVLVKLLEQDIGSVAYCCIEQDKTHSYPKGAACVVFCSREDYIKAIAVHEVILRFPDGDRKVEMKSFLLDNMPCEKCTFATKNTKFCGEMICLAYFCDSCWKDVHNPHRPGMASHVPLRKAHGRRAS